MNPPYYLETQTAIFVFIFMMLLASIFKQRYAVCAYLGIMIFRPGEVYSWVGAMRFELVVVAYLGLSIIIRGKANALWDHRLSKAVFFFFTVAFLSIIQAYNVSASYDYAYANLFPIVIFFAVLIGFSEKPSDIRFLLYVYLGIVAYLAWLPIFNHLHGIGVERHGAGIIHSTGNTMGVTGHVGLANLMTQSIPFAYFMMLSEKAIFKKILLLAFIGIFVFATIASGSRGGFLGLLVCGGLFVYKAKNKGLTVVIMIICGLIAMSFMSANYLGWMSTIEDLGNTEYSASSRWIGLRHGIEMAIRRPILGVGIGCYAIARSAWFGWGIWAHNLYGELIGELGILGIISWGGFIYLCFIEMKKIRKYIQSKPSHDEFLNHLINACWAVLILRLVLGMTSHSLMVYIWYMIGGILIVCSKWLGQHDPEYRTMGNNTST